MPEEESHQCQENKGLNENQGVGPIINFPTQVTSILAYKNTNLEALLPQILDLSIQPYRVSKLIQGIGEILPQDLEIFLNLDGLDATVCRRITEIALKVDINLPNAKKILLEIIRKFPNQSRELVEKFTDLSIYDIKSIILDQNLGYSSAVYALISKVKEVTMEELLEFIPVSNFPGSISKYILILAGKLKVGSLGDIQDFLVEGNEPMVAEIIQKNTLYDDQKLLESPKKTLVLYLRYGQFDQSYHNALRSLLGHALQTIEGSEIFGKVCVVPRFSDRFDIQILKDNIDNPKFHFSFATEEDFLSLSRGKNIHFVHLSHGSPQPFDDSIGVQIITSEIARQCNVDENTPNVIIINTAIDGIRADDYYKGSPAKKGFSQELNLEFDIAFQNLVSKLTS